MRCAELGLALFTGCVIGWWWGERPDLLRGFSWLEAMTAFGTVGAVVWAVAASFVAERRTQAANGRYISAYMLANKRAWQHSVGAIAGYFNMLNAVRANPKSNTVPPGIFSKASDFLAPLIMSNELIASIGERSANKGTLLAEISAGAAQLSNSFNMLGMLGHGSSEFIEFADKVAPNMADTFAQMRENLAVACAPHEFVEE